MMHRRASGDMTALAGLAAGARIIGLDPGRKRIGVAISDTARRWAQGHSVLRRTRLTEDLVILDGLAAEWQAGGFVIGLPLLMSGGEGKQAQLVREFARLLAAHCGLPVAFQDERLSTIGARKTLDALPLPAKRKAAILDAQAAKDILQTALYRLARDEGSVG